MKSQTDKNTSDSHSKSARLITIAVLGVVYGDIGTSPIYALRECFFGKNPVPASPENILGILSLIFWTLILVISVKYMIFVLRADNQGEGGIFALLALLKPDKDQDRRRRRGLILLGMLGASMLYGSIMITPAISVLSAVEGLQIAAPELHSYIIPITVGILLALFFVQKHGSAKVGAIFGPLTAVWFSALGILGIYGISQHPGVLLAINPVYAIDYFRNNGISGYMALYAVFLVSTGGEALYADLGHFGRIPIRKVWFSIVLPALLLNYFGQGALLIANPATSNQPFFNLAPSWGLYPLIILTTAATIIASQAVITGSYSLTRQAIHLGMMPRLDVEHTSADVQGQIYMPGVNWVLMLAAISLVLLFRSSGELAAAYGVAVNSTMAITTVLAYRVARERGNWKPLSALAFLLIFLSIDLSFLGSNMLLIPAGGWLPLLIGISIFTIMTSWRKGSRLMCQQISQTTTSLETFIGKVTAEKVPRVAGTAVFFTESKEQISPALKKLLQHTAVLHETIILVRVVIEPVAKIKPEQRLELIPMEAGFYRLIIRYGYMQRPNIPSELSACIDLSEAQGMDFEMNKIDYFIDQIDMKAGRKLHGMASWRDHLFVRMAINTQNETATYQIPDAQIMKVGMQIGI